MDVGVLGIVTDVGACAGEILTVDIDPRIARRMLRLAPFLGDAVDVRNS